MNIHNVKTGEWKENCFIVSDENNAALLIDPGDNFEKIKDYIFQNNLKPIAIINTHAHFDHVGAISQLKQEYGIPFYLHKKELPLLKRANLYKAAFVGKAGIVIPTVDTMIEDDSKTLEIGSFHLIIHHTPGHTNGGICIQIGDNLFSGDSLLSSNLIPKKLPEENSSLLMTSLKYLQTLNPEIVNYPGHGGQNVLGTQVGHILSNWGSL